jgi:23S rRNA (uracil1939-C5)-methyltransferase
MTVPSAAPDAHGAGPDRGPDPHGRDDVVDVRAERLVAGGLALARREDGRIVLVEGALPGERLRVALDPGRLGVDRGRVVEVTVPSPDRRAPHCPHVLDGCGGCDLAGFEPAAQVDAKVEIVADALRRIGHLPDPVVRPGPALAPTGFRTTLRLAVVDGRAGLRAAGSHDVVTLDRCVVAHPALEDMVVNGRFDGATEVTLRVGAATGERLALVDPSAAGTTLADDVVVVGADELGAGRRAWIHEEVAGRRWRISAGSFFQTRPDGADALVAVVHAAAADVLALGPRAEGRPRTLVDAYCGVGLFAGSLLDRLEAGGRAGEWRAVAVERSRSSVADARRNLADLPARVIGSSVERFRPPRAELVVADPSRAGLGRGGVAVLAATGATRLVLVSCDAASAGRDAAVLGTAGYRHVESVVVDLFPHTGHVEVVTRFDRAD